MILKELEKNWQKFAEMDALWSILTHPDKKNRRWDLSDFLETGRVEVDDLMQQIQSKQMFESRLRVLDFGCGVGRLSQAFAKHFIRVDGVDIAQSMIDFANRINQHPAICYYHVNTADNLSIFEDNCFDLIYSNIVLQHMAPDYAKVFLREFFRVIKPSGFVIFQLPSHKKHKLKVSKWRSYLPWLKSFFTKTRSYSYTVRVADESVVMEMNGMAKQEVVKFLLDLGFVIYDVRPDFSTGANWISYQYWVKRK